MKKITIIGDFCYPNFAGGSSKHVFDLLTYFPEYDCNVRLLTRRRDSDSQYAADDPGAAGKYDALKKRGNIRELSGMGLFNPYPYIRIIAGADHVLLQHPVMGMIGGIAARIMGKHTVYHYHGPLHLEYQAKSGRKGLRYHILWLFQKITTVCSSVVLVHSEYMKRTAQKEHRIPNRKIRLLPPYIKKPASFVPLPWWKDETDKTVLFIPRRLTARTGIYEFLMRFLSLPADEQQKYHIYISGTGELAPKIETIAKEYPQTITYLGFVPYEELWAIYGKADAVVVPTLSLEGFGYVILEAMACGCAATVSTTCGGGYEFVSEQLGEEYTFDTFDTESILKALRFIKARPADRAFYQQIASRFSPEHMIRYYLQTILK